MIVPVLIAARFVKVSLAEFEGDVVGDLLEDLACRTSTHGAIGRQPDDAIGHGEKTQSDLERTGLLVGVETCANHIDPAREEGMDLGREVAGIVRLGEELCFVDEDDLDVVLDFRP